MAIIKCPNCGKQITDRMEKCPHCNVILIEKNHEEPITKESIKTSAKDSIIGVVSAIVLTVVVEQIWHIFSIVLVGRIIGSGALAAFLFAADVFYSKSLILLSVGGILFCALSIFFKQKSATQFLGGIIITVLFGAIGFIIQNSAIMNYNAPGDILPYAKTLSLGFGFAFPMVLGCLSISSYERKFKESLLMQAICGGVFIVSSILMGVLFIAVMKMGTFGLSLACLSAAIIILVLAVLTNKGFQQLITPRKIS